MEPAQSTAIDQRERERGTLSLGDFTGRLERSIQRADSAAAIDLIAKVLDNRSPQDALPYDALKMTAAERDVILADIYGGLYGDKIDSTLQCSVCTKPFDIGFSLRALRNRQQPDWTNATPVGDGSFRVRGGVRFRLPTGEDELSVTSLTATDAVRELLRRCVLETPEGYDVASPDNMQALQDAMEQVAPILDVDIQTSCPECGVPAKVRFDLQAYLLQSILNDRRRLWRETHLLASAYKWSLDEIHGLTRADRRTLVSLIESDAGRRAVI